MRTYLVILILIFSSYASAVQAADVILGTVNSINHEKGEMVINVIDILAHDLELENGQNQETIVVKFDPKDSEFLNISSGRLIRVWGNYINDSSKIFKSQSMSQRGFNGRKNDPTGVRSRLGRGKASGRGMHGKGRGRQ